MEPGSQWKDYRISAAHDQNTENSTHEEGGEHTVYSVKQKLTYRQLAL